MSRLKFILKQINGDLKKIPIGIYTCKKIMFSVEGDILKPSTKITAFDSPGGPYYNEYFGFVQWAYCTNQNDYYLFFLEIPALGADPDKLRSVLLN